MGEIIVLGTGLVGSAMAADLALKYDVTALDLNTELFDRLEEKGVNTKQVDLSLPVMLRTDGSLRARPCLTWNYLILRWLENWRPGIPMDSDH